MCMEETQQTGGWEIIQDASEGACAAPKQHRDILGKVNKHENLGDAHNMCGFLKICLFI